MTKIFPYDLVKVKSTNRYGFVDKVNQAGDEIVVVFYSVRALSTEIYSNDELIVVGKPKEFDDIKYGDYVYVSDLDSMYFGCLGKINKLIKKGFSSLSDVASVDIYNNGNISKPTKNRHFSQCSLQPYKLIKKIGD